MQSEQQTKAQKRRNQQGFTLMELLIVIIILGFLLGMIMPRLSAIVSGDAVDNVCDTNNKGMRQYTNMILQRQGHLPQGLTNLVNSDSNGTNYYPLSISDGNPNNGPEALAGEFFERNALGLHQLSADEAAEIKNELGINYVYNLNNDQEQKNGTVNNLDRPLYEDSIKEGLGVAMVGVGDYLAAGSQDVTAGTALTSDPSNWDGSNTTVFPQGNPYWLGRIIMGIGKNSELVTNGYIQAAALCPGGIQNADNVIFNHYCLILPRLQATVTNNIGTNLNDGDTVTFVDAADTENGEQVTMTWEAQAPWQFEFTCPEGHKWPDNDNDYWVINP